MSHHLFDHSIGRMMVHLLGLLSSSPDLEVMILSSHLPKTDEDHDQVEDYLKQVVPYFIRIPYDIEAAQQGIAEQELDILIYPDIGMEPLTYFLAFSRLAPIQMAWWGHPITSGLPSIDYFISLDDEIVEASDDHYTEQMVRMRFVNAPSMATVSKSVGPLCLPSLVCWFAVFLPYTQYSMMSPLDRRLRSLQQT